MAIDPSDYEAQSTIALVGERLKNVKTGGDAKVVDFSDIDIPSGSIVGSMLADRTITGQQIGIEAVLRGNIDDGAINDDKIDNESVRDRHIMSPGLSLDSINQPYAALSLGPASSSVGITRVVWSDATFLVSRGGFAVDSSDPTYLNVPSPGMYEISAGVQCDIPSGDANQTFVLLATLRGSSVNAELDLFRRPQTNNYRQVLKAASLVLDIPTAGANPGGISLAVSAADSTASLPVNIQSTSVRPSWFTIKKVS